MKSLCIPDYRLGAYTETVQASQWAREAAYKYSTNPRSGCGGIEVQHVPYFGQRGIQVQHIPSFGLWRHTGTAHTLRRAEGAYKYKYSASRFVGLKEAAYISRRVCLVLP